MIRKGIIFLIICIFSILIAGCQTIKGICKGAAEGAKKDWQAIQCADEWMRENLW